MNSRGRPRLALSHGEAELDADDVALLRDAAAALAGQSSMARDLSLLLERALTQDGAVVLRRSELRLLVRLAASNRLSHVVAILSNGAYSAAAFEGTKTRMTCMRRTGLA